MAGVYGDAPSRRIAYDVDGSVLLAYYTPNNVGSGPSVGGHGIYSFFFPPDVDIGKVNNENSVEKVFTSYDTSAYDDRYSIVSIVFPENREIDGVYVLSIGDTNWWTASSQDSTNGVDGVWSDMSYAHDNNNYHPSDRWRTQIVNQSLSDVKSIKMNAGGIGTYATASYRSIHLYGTISPGETPDRILFLDTANSDAEFTKVLDYGEVPRGQTQTRTIKLKNNSATKTINTLQLTAEDLYLNAGGFYTFSLDDVSYQATLGTIGNLGPGATKLIYVKQSVPDAETLGLQTGRLKVSHASLT